MRLQLKGNKRKSQPTVQGESYQNWHQLPIELLGEIFLYLSPKSLARVAKVSQTWRKVASSPFVWKSLIEKNWMFAVANYEKEIDLESMDFSVLKDLVATKRNLRCRHIEDARNFLELRCTDWGQYASIICQDDDSLIAFRPREVGVDPFLS